MNRRIIVRTLAGLLMFNVALLCAFFAMRLAIHGREVVVPSLSGKSDADAAAAIKSLGLDLSVENRFYSGAVPPNHVLSQSPIAGARVRRGWQVRVTESLGGQKTEVPDLTGQTERPASLVLRRLQLEPGSVAHLPAPGEPGVVLAQSPPANSAGLSDARVGLLISDPDDTAEKTAYIMPAIIGMSLSDASNRLAAVGLHVANATQPSNAPVPASPDPTVSATPADPATAGLQQAFDVPVTPPPVDFNAAIISQSPAPGHRVSRADSIRVVLGASPGTPPQ